MALLRTGALGVYQALTGRRILPRLQELNQTQTLSRQELLDLQQRKLHKLLTYANAHVPYYQRVFRECGFEPAQLFDDPGSFAKVPLLNKAIIHEHFDELITTEESRRAGMNKLTTGGSTGHPLIFMQDTDFRDYVTVDIQRHLGWAGWEMGQLHAYIWGASFEVATAQSIRTKLLDWVWNRFLTNAYVLSDESMGVFVDRVRRQKPRLLFGYSSSLHRFARFVREKGFADITFEGIFSSAEVLFDHQRQYIEETFQCKMFNRYGSRELGGIACECEAHTDLHVSAENNYIEILTSLPDGQPTAPGETGHLIVTNLNNLGMPFIRYEIGDMGAWSTLEQCSCGRELPMIKVVFGRRIDMFRTRDGRSVWGGVVSPMFAIDGINRFQLVQKTLDLVVARIVKEGELEQSKLDAIERSIKIALGDNVEVQFDFVDDIPVLSSGKYKYAISELEN